MSRNFKSDNVTPVCDAIMAAINAANVGSVPSYGGDDFTTPRAHVDEFLAAAQGSARG